MPAEKTKIKSTKPLMEKRRRARINDSLMQLKTLVLDALNKNNPRHSKLEKADILEMTVRYLRTIQRQQISASVNSDPSKLGQYRSGYAECVNEVTRYLGATSAADGAPELRTQLVGHLANLCTSSQQSSPTRTPSPKHHQQQQAAYYATTIRQQQQLHVDTPASYAETPRNTAVAMNRMSPSVDSSANVPMRHNAVSPVPEGAHVEYALTAPVYNTHNSQKLRMSPTTVHHTAAQIPQTSARMAASPPLDVTGSTPSGEITLVLPQQALPNGQLPTHFIPVYAQGPVAVSPTTNIVNPSNADGSHRSMSPSSAATATAVPVAPANKACVSPMAYAPSPVQQYQTELSPISHGQFTYPKSAVAMPYANQFATKKDAMWRPW